jgi:hypothetical protein
MHPGFPSSEYSFVGCKTDYTENTGRNIFELIKVILNRGWIIKRPYKPLNLSKISFQLLFYTVRIVANIHVMCGKRLAKEKVKYLTVHE